MRSVNDLIQFAEGCLTSIQPRDDYHELLQLWIVILGNVQPGGQMISFRQPGALHRARWMAKQIYTIKIYLFHEQFSLTARELKGLLDFILFIVQVYLKAWFQAPVGIQAPRIDLQLLKDIQTYKSVYEDVATAVLEKYLNHQWYLSEEL